MEPVTSRSSPPPSRGPRSPSWRALLGVALAGALCLLAPRPALAQIDPYFVYRVEIDGVDVGRIFRVEASNKAYTDHWILFPGYVFPNVQNNKQVVIVPTPASFRTVKSYLVELFRPGSTYVKAFTRDAVIPGR